MKIDFPTLLVLLSLVTGLIWLFDVIVLNPRRLKKAAKSQDYESKIKPIKRPWLVENARGIFPIIVVVLILRSFIYEPFRIPSESMLPTLENGDFILVNKFSYGIRLPIIDKKIVGSGVPKRGDVVVFRYPLEPSVDYIKRVIGLPGENIVYTPDKKVYVDGELLVQENDEVINESVYKRRMIEKKGDKQNVILIDDRIPISQTVDESKRVPETSPDASKYCQGWNTCWSWDVPAGHYLMMGDNRDGSSDGRRWGFVPDENLVGRADLILMNFNIRELSFKGSRIFNVIH